LNTLSKKKKIDFLRSAIFKLSRKTKWTTSSRNDQHYALILPLLYSMYWLLHVSAVAYHHQGAS
jgi:hypothetical protein